MDPSTANAILGRREERRGPHTNNQPYTESTVTRLFKQLVARFGQIGRRRADPEAQDR